MWYLEEMNEKRHYGPITANAFIIGRNPNANIILKNLQVSRRHCILVMKDHSVYIQDLGSANGIYINGIKMDTNSERLLTENDLVGVGNDMSQTENSCVFRLLKVDEIVNTDDMTVLENKSLNAKRPSNWDNVNERSNKKLKINLNSLNENDNIELPSTSKSNENKIETNGIKIEAMDENSVDMFSENVIERQTDQIKTENITILSLLDSDEEENAFVKTNCAQTKHDDYITISSDDDDEEEDNPWLERLSQRSNRSPPPQSDSWTKKEDEENNQWWPELSQNILDEINQEDEAPGPYNVHNNIKSSKEPDKNKVCSDLKDCRIEIQDILNKNDKNNEALNSIVNNLRKERPNKYIKPPIIEAPALIIPVKESKKIAVKSSTEKIDKKDKKEKKEKKDVKRKSDKKSIKDTIRKDTKRKSKTPEKVIKRKDDANSELRKLRLKELTASKSNKSEKSPSTDSKEKLKPKVKYTTRNRSDLFTAEILKTVDKPAQCTSKSTEKISMLKNREILHNGQIKVKSNNKLLSPINYNEIIGKNDSNRKLPSFTKKKVVQNTETNKTTSVQSFNDTTITKQKLNKSKKRVSFNLTPSIRLFTKDCHEETAPFVLLRDRRPLIDVSEHDCFYQEDIIYEIVNWEPKCLLSSNTPINLMKNVQQNNIVYDNFQNYYHTFKNLMMLELWSLIHDEYNMNDFLKRVFLVDIKSFYAYSEEMQKNRKMYNLECQLLLTKQDDQNMIHPKIGDAIIIKLMTETENGIQDSTNRFGFVTSIRKQSINQFRDELPLQLIASVGNPQVLVTFMVLTRWDPNNLITDNCVQVRRLGRIAGVMKEFIALQKLPQSPLMPLILNPNNLNKIKNHYNVETLSCNVLNVDQREIIFQVTGSCLSTDPSISIIHGPPGTGKSFLIVNLVTHLLYGNDRYNNCIKNRNNLPRILICAPTNSAIDDIVIKLLSVRKKISNPKFAFRMVRVGQRNKMHSSVQHISLQSLKEYNSNLEMFKESGEFNKASNNNRNPQMNNIKKDAFFQQNKPKKVIDEDIIIKKADIICTTLGSSYSAQLERLAKTKSFRFTTCIIDEATQCTEPTALLPLMLGIDSLVLVGDTNQLPATIKSQEAKKYGLGQSLFERIEKCFSMNNINNCPNIRSLSVQYRMHPEIMEFPNKYFYGNRLINSQNVYDYRFPLIPYQLFLHEFEQCSSMDNSREAEFILNMLKTILCEVNDKVTIGIITPYQNQRTKIMKILENIERKEQKIVVNTVDGFQGQEKDIIILSCVRTEGFGFLAEDQRLNVALTRAKHSFYIVGNFQALQMNPTWRALKEDADHRKKIFYTKNVMISPDVFSKILKDKNFVK